MKKIFALKMLLVALFMTVAVSGTVSAKEVTLINQTGYDIVVLNCTPTKSNNWYEDLLGNGVWRNGTSFVLDFDRYCMSDNWDFKAHYSNGYSDEWYNVDVRKISTIILNKDGTNTYK